MSAHPELKPCPNPECNGEAALQPPNPHYVSCSSCGLFGPSPELTKSTAEEAARLWNLLPRMSDVADAWDAGRQEGRADVGKYSNAIGRIEGALGITGPVPLDDTVAAVIDALADAWDAGAEEAIGSTPEAHHYAPPDYVYAKNPHRKPVTP